MKKHFLRFALLLAASILRGVAADAQELNLNVKVINPQVRTADPKTFVSMEAALKELVNNTKWTDDVFEQNERLTGSMTLTIDKENSATNFTCKLAIQISRPIYGSETSTPIFTHQDAAITFEYQPFQPLQYARNNYSDNLTATISYYVYLALGMDYDSFSPQGGESYWQLAQDIYNVLPDGIKIEWKGKALGNTERYWFVENLLSPRLKNYRQAIYEYHRQGLDVASTDMTRCKALLMQALEHMEEAHQSYPNTLAVRMFVNTKGDELIEIFKAAAPDVKAKFIAIMTRLDPANSSRFAQVGF